MGKNSSLNLRTERACASQFDTESAGVHYGAGVKRILVISHCFPPQKIPRAVQLFKLFRYFSGWTDFYFDVLTIRPRYASEKIETALAVRSSNIKIHYAFGFEVNYFFNFLAGRFFDWLPDGKIIWRFFAQRKARHLLAKNRYDIIISFSQYFSSAVVGARLKAQYPSIPLISYFSDPWVASPYFPKLNPKKQTRNEKAEEAVIRLSDSLVFTNQEAANLYQQKYGQDIVSKIAVIPHSFDSSLYPSVPSLLATDKIRIVHTGNFYAQRSPKNFLLAIRHLFQEKFIDPSQLEIVFYGHVTPAVKKDLAEADLLGLAFWRSAVPYLESLRILSSAHLLLNIDAPFDESPFLPSKLIDYLGAGRPILAITPEKGAAADLISELRLQGLPYFLADAGDVDGIADVFRNTLEYCRTVPQKEFKPPREFDIKNVGEKWRCLFSI